MCVFCYEFIRISYVTQNTKQQPEKLSTLFLYSDIIEIYFLMLMTFYACDTCSLKSFNEKKISFLNSLSMLLLLLCHTYYNSIWSTHILESLYTSLPPESS